jgi:GT2 family glycosyltransferase
MVLNFLAQLDGELSLKGTKVILTLNNGEVIDTPNYQNIEVVTVCNSYPRGFGANHNAAFELCNTTWFAVLNPDLKLDKSEPFTKLVNLCCNDQLSKVGLIAPKIIDEKGMPEDSVRENLSLWSVIKRQLFGRVIINEHIYHDQKTKFLWFGGMCLLLNSAAFKAVGGFDQRFFLYCEDYDLCARLHIHGYQLLYSPEISIVHMAQRDSHRSIHHFFLHISSLIRVWISAPFWRICFFG